jgi:hypothetical protein
MELIKIESDKSIDWINISRIDTIRYSKDSGEFRLEFTGERTDYYYGEEAIAIIEKLHSLALDYEPMPDLNELLD